MEIHVDPFATPRAFHTPASVPPQWQQHVHEDLLRDEALRVIERVSGASFSKCLSNVRPNSDVFDSSPSKNVRTTPSSKHFRKLKHIPSFNVTAFK